MYNESQIKNAMYEIKKFNITTYKKAEHKTKIYQLLDLINNHLYPINSGLFNEYDYYFSQYKIAVIEQYNITTKKELDHKLKRVLQNFNNELKIILREYC